MSTESTRSSVDLSKLSIQPLSSTLNRAAFSCGNARIDNFFRINARDQHERHKVRVYVAIYEQQIIGFYYLVAQSTPPAKLSQEAVRKFARVNAAPCVYLGMIATHKDFQRNGIGKILMVHAMRRTLEVANIIGIYALTLEAIDQETAERYKRWGFSYFIKGELAMFLPFRTIKEILGDIPSAAPGPSR